MRVSLGIHAKSQLRENTKHCAFSFQEHGLRCHGICHIICQSRRISFITGILNQIKTCYPCRIFPVNGSHGVIFKRCIISQNCTDVSSPCALCKVKAPAHSINLILTFSMCQLLYCIRELSICPTFIRHFNAGFVKHIFVNHDICIVIKFSRQSPDRTIIKYIFRLCILA